MKFSLASSTLTAKQKLSPVHRVAEGGRGTKTTLRCALSASNLMQLVKSLERTLHPLFGELFQRTVIPGEFCESGEFVNRFKRVSIGCDTAHKHLDGIGSDIDSGGNLIIYWHIFHTFTCFLRVFCH